VLTSGLDFYLVPVIPKAKYNIGTVAKPTLIVTLMLAYGTNYITLLTQFIIASVCFHYEGFGLISCCP